MTDILSFTGLLQTTTSSFLRTDSQLELCINVNGDDVGTLTVRPGYSKFGSSVSSSPIRGAVSYPRLADSTQRVFNVSNGALTYGTGGAWTSIATGLTTDAKPEFRVFLDQLFMVGANSSNTYLSSANINGTSYSTTNNLTSAPNARFIEVFQNQLYMADTYESGTRYASRLRRSSVPNSAGDTITWPTDNYDDIYTNNGEAIMGLHTNKRLNQLLIFKETSLHAWDTFRVLDVGNIGTTAHRSIVTINFTTFFFNANQGILKYTGQEPTLISRPIDKWIKGIVDPTVVQGGKVNERIYKLYVGDVTVDGITYTNCEFRYAVLDNTWTVYSYYDNFTCYFEHKVSGVIRLYAGAADGDIHQLALSSDTVYADDSQPIAWEFMTKALDLRRPGDKKFVYRAVIFASQCQSMTGRMRKRGGDWSTHFNVDESEQPVNLSGQDGRFLQFHFSGSSVLTPSKFEGIEFLTQTTSPNA